MTKIKRLLKKCLSYSLVICLLGSFTLLSGCLSEHDAKTAKNFKFLQKYHLQFIDTYTESPEKVWNPETFKLDVATGNGLFETAIDYERSHHHPDDYRRRAFKILHDQYDTHVELLRSYPATSSHFFSPAVAESIKAQIKRNYKAAMDGELARAKSRD